MGVLIGTTGISNAYVGSTPLSKIYIGTEMIWPPGKVLREEFSGYANQAGWGPNFGAQTGPQILSGKASAATVGANQNKTDIATYIGGGSTASQLLTDNYSVTAQLIRSDKAQSSWDTYLFMRGAYKTTLGPQSIVGVALSSDPPSGNTKGSRIVTWNSGGTIANRVTGGPAIPPTSLVRLEGIGNVYSVYLNSDTNPILTWVDSGNVIAQGVGRRGFGMGMQAEYPLFNQLFHSSSVSWIEARDV